MNPLEEQLVGLGRCPYCHKKSLSGVYSAEDSCDVASVVVKFKQCKTCLRVYVLEEDIKTSLTGTREE